MKKVFGTIAVAVILGVIIYSGPYGEKTLDTIRFTYETRGIQHSQVHDAREWNRPMVELNAARFTSMYNDNIAASGGRAGKIVDIQYCAHSKQCVSWMHNNYSR